MLRRGAFGNFPQRISIERSRTAPSGAKITSDVAKNTMYKEKCLGFDTIILVFTKKGNFIWHNEKHRILLKKWRFIVPQNPRFQLKRVSFFHLEAKRGCFSSLGTNLMAGKPWISHPNVGHCLIFSAALWNNGSVRFIQTIVRIKFCRKLVLISGNSCVVK